jgi:hypothetical protein
MLALARVATSLRVLLVMLLVMVAVMLLLVLRS